MKNKKHIITLEFENKYHKKLFESWMSNLGEQLFDRQLDIEKEITSDFGEKSGGGCPIDLLNKDLNFKYQKNGIIKITTSE